MARILKDGDIVQGYKIIGAPLHRGAFAISYKATNGRETCFFKQYKSPTGTVPWFKAYLKHLLVMKKRIETSPCQNITYRFVDIFEDKNTLYQVFEFIPEQNDLAKLLEEFQKKRIQETWEKRVLFAKLLMYGMNIFHQSKIIHSDLKPENVVLIKAPEIGTGYRFKIADLDFSFMADTPVPWKGSSQGFVGTPGYFSPEHLRGQQPTTASDVFTCGIILYELLCGKSPYPDPEDAEEFKNKVESWSVMPPRLLDEYPGGGSRNVSDIILRCLNPDPKKRPSAKEVHRVLLGKHGSTAGGSLPGLGTPAFKPGEETPTVVPAPDSLAPKSKPDADLSPAGDEIWGVAYAGMDKTDPAVTNETIELVYGAKKIQAKITTVFGATALAQLGDEARFACEKQFTLEKTAEGWFVDPNPSAPNETILNRETLRSKTRLKSGDELSIGRAAKGAFKLQMKVTIYNSYS